jgi:membrane fusion protein (multidrug efflux system)
MRKKVWNIAWILLMGGLVMTGCKQAPQAQMGANYSLMSVTTTDAETQSQYAATIQGRQDIDIYPQVAGTITKVCVSEGDVVTKGQSLFIIDQVPYQAALQTAKANLQAAKAALSTAQLTYNSKKELFDKKVVSAFDLQTAENSLLTAKAQVAQMEALELSARNNLSYTVVKSPSNGIVGTIPYRVGALVSASIPQALTTVSDNSEMYVYFSMNENQLLALTRQYGSAAKAIAEMPEVTLQLNDGSEYGLKGKVESISGVLDRQTGAVTLRAVFANPDRLLCSGATGNVIIPGIYKDAIVIPQAATVRLQDKIMVYKVVDGKAVSALITVAPNNDGQTYIVTGGLEAGEEIVAEGAGLVREGTQVK